MGLPPNPGHSPGYLWDTFKLLQSICMNIEAEWLPCRELPAYVVFNRTLCMPPEGKPSEAFWKGDQFSRLLLTHQLAQERRLPTPEPECPKARTLARWTSHSRWFAACAAQAGLLASELREANQKARCVRARPAPARGRSGRYCLE